MSELSRRKSTINRRGIAAVSIVSAIAGGAATEAVNLAKAQPQASEAIATCDVPASSVNTTAALRQRIDKTSGEVVSGDFPIVQSDGVVRSGANTPDLYVPGRYPLTTDSLRAEVSPTTCQQIGGKIISVTVK